jgi:NADP-dependent 3-hydroxy acid dehydrogenase YdfG
MKNPIAKTVLITGATSGIGRACATLFAKKGFNVIITGRRGEKLKHIAEKLSDKYAIQVVPLKFDIRKKEACKKAWNSLNAQWKKVDILINNAGLASGLDFIHQGKIDDWEVMIDTNIKGLLYMTKLVSPGMVKRNSGFIINVCSTAGHEVYPKGNVYCATKHAVDALTHSMRLDLHRYGVRVGQVSPGMVEETEFAEVRFHGDKEKAKIYEDFKPLSSRDVADIIYFMSTRPKHVNIQDILVMGSQQASSNHVDRSGR